MTTKKVRDLKVGDVILKRSDLEYGRVGKVVKIEKRGGNSPVKEIFLEGARRGARIHSTVNIEIEGHSTTGKGFAQ